MSDAAENHEIGLEETAVRLMLRDFVPALRQALCVLGLYVVNCEPTAWAEFYEDSPWRTQIFYRLVSHGPRGRVEVKFHTRAYLLKRPADETLVVRQRFYEVIAQGHARHAVDELFEKIESEAAQRMAAGGRP